jgi:hypothetical protein
LSEICQEAPRIREQAAAGHRFFSNQDAPVTVGLLIDSSGSMGESRMVIAASLAFSKAMNPLMNSSCSGSTGGSRPLPSDAPFTHHEPTLRVALARLSKLRPDCTYNAVNAGL